MDAFFQSQMGLEASPPQTLQNRAKESLSDYLSKFPWDSFYTVTFSSPMRYPAGVLDKLRGIIPMVSDRSIGVAEQHVSGFWHAHGLLYYHHQPGFTFASDNNYSKLRLARLGFGSVSLVRSETACSIYCSKYLAKNSPFEYEFWGKNRYWTIPTKSDIVSI